MSAAAAGNALARDPFADATPRRTWLIWTLALIVGLALHAGGCWMVLRARSAHEPLPPPLPPAVMIDLAPLPTAPPVMPPVPDAVSPPAPPPVPAPKDVPAPQLAAPVVPVPRVEQPAAKPRVNARVNARVNPPPKRERRVAAREAPPPRQIVRPPVRPTTAPARALAVPMRGPAAAPPAMTAPRTTTAPPATTVSAWQSLVLRRLEQVKRYPASAQSLHQQGVAYLRFTMNRQGQVLSARVERSSGFDSLDVEALALVHRAAPLPPPPPGVSGDSITLVVPVSFHLDE